MSDKQRNLDDWQEMISTSAVPLPEQPDRQMLIQEHGKTLSDTFMEEVQRVRDEANEWQMWALCEIQHWRERCEELELELLSAEADGFEMILNQKIRQAKINPKERKLF